MKIIGFESSCDETAVSVLEADEQGKLHILSNAIASQVDTHRLYGGVVPEIASRAHIEAVSRITYEALETAGITLRDVGLVAVTSHPGLIGALLVGVNFAKSLAYANNIPLVGVNHIKGHIAANYLAFEELEPPFTALVVSGGHTSIYSADSYTALHEIGATRDDAAGEAFDKIGRVIGLPYPAGAAMDKLACEGDKHAVTLPSPALAGDTLDFSFSGIKTAALNYINNSKQSGAEINRADLAASYTEKIVSAVTKKAEAALGMTGSKKLVVAGGVAANSHLRASLETMCKKHGVEFFVPPLSLCGDNAAMIAAAGYYKFLDGKTADTSLNASALD